MVWQALEENYGGVERMRNQVGVQPNRSFRKVKEVRQRQYAKAEESSHYS